MRTLLLEAILKISQYAIADPNAFAQQIRAEAEIQHEAAAKELKRQLTRDRKALRTEKTQLENEVEALRPDVEVVQDELDELKTVQYWVRKVIPDALPSRTESGAPSIRNTLEESQNQNALHALLERTAEQVITPQQEEVHRAKQRQRNETL